MKHTLHNVLEVPEVVINIVTKDIVAQASLASSEYPDGVDEFVKAGFAKQPATIVKPPMVLESKAKLECKVIEVKPLGQKGGAGNLVICEVLAIHIDDTLYDQNGQFDTHKLNLVARLGGDAYCEINSSNLFSLPKPKKTAAIGMDALPAFIRETKYLSAHYLAALALVESIPETDPFFTDERLDAMSWLLKHDRKDELLFDYIKKLIDEQNIDYAWQVLLRYQNDNQNKTVDQPGHKTTIVSN